MSLLVGRIRAHEFTDHAFTAVFVHPALGRVHLQQSSALMGLRLSCLRHRRKQNCYDENVEFHCLPPARTASFRGVPQSCALPTSHIKAPTRRSRWSQVRRNQGEPYKLELERSPAHSV